VIKVVSVDKEKCIGCGLCTSICPEVFVMGNDGKAEVKNQGASKEEEKVKNAADSCPVDAISL